MTIDFIGIGVPKAATTWIYQCLSEHPQICMSSAKEIDYFFDENYQHGSDWYAAHFKHCKKRQLKGEYSPNYLYEKKAAQRIKKDFSAVKLIISLRNPVERFISAHYFEYAMGRHKELDISFLADKRLQKNLSRGLYSKYLKSFFEHFDREQILVLIYEDIEKDPIAFIQNIFLFLGVDENFIPPCVNTRTNVTNLDRTRIRWIKKLYYTLYHRSSKSIFRTPLRLLGVGKLARILLSFNDRGGEIPLNKPVPQHIRGQLYEYYQGDIGSLETLIGNSLPQWKL